MTTGNTYGGVEEEDNGLIRSLRSDIDNLTKELKQAREAAAEEVRREFQAKSLLGEQYVNLAEYFVQEVDGELTPEVANEWLAAKGLSTATPEPVEAPEPATPNTAQAVAELGNLGGTAAAVSTSSNEPGFVDRMGDIKGEFAGKMHPSNMPDFTARVNEMLEG